MAHAQKADLVFQRNEQSIYVVGSNTGWNVIRVKHEDYQQHKWARSFRWKTKSAFCACAIIFRFYSNTGWTVIRVKHEDYQQHKWARSFPWKTKSAFCACAITFRFYSTRNISWNPQGLSRPVMGLLYLYLYIKYMLGR